MDKYIHRVVLQIEFVKDFCISQRSYLMLEKIENMSYIYLEMLCGFFSVLIMTSSTLFKSPLSNKVRIKLKLIFMLSEARSEIFGAFR